MARSLQFGTVLRPFRGGERLTLHESPPSIMGRMTGGAGLGHVALGAWSGGRFMRFGEEISEERLTALMRPQGDGIATVLTADTYGQGAADRLVGRAVEGIPREEFQLVGAVGHDFYDGEREGAKGFPRFTHPELRSEDDYAAYLRRATEESARRCGVDHFDVLLLHNPDRTGYTSPAVWEGMRALRAEGLTKQIGVAPGPANGFTLDLLQCFETFGADLDWAMVILNPLEPWPGELVLPAAEEHGIDVITRVADYGGLFHDDVLPGHPFPHHDHRTFRPEGWVERGRERMDAIRPIAERHGLTMLQLAAQWNLAHPAVRTVAPTLIQEPGEQAKSIEQKRAELAATPREVLLSAEEVDEIRRLGDNTGSMTLKGAAPDHEGEERPDRWAVSAELHDLGRRHGIEASRDLVRT